MSRKQSPDTVENETPGLDVGPETLDVGPGFDDPTRDPDGHESNAHLALVYESREERLATVIPFLREGLERGERCMYVGSESAIADVIEALSRTTVDVDTARESGALAFATVRETYLQDGSFEVEGMLETHAETIADANEEYEAFRLAAETSWLLEANVSVEAFLEYESRVNELLADADCTGLCLYDREAFPPEALREVLRVHPHLVCDEAVHYNDYYVPPEEFCGENPAHEIDRMLGTLRDRTKTKTALTARERYLRELNEITADPDAGFEEKLDALFELGCKRFGLELGAMARVDVEADEFEIEAVSDDHEHFEPGVELPLSETYCTAATDIRAAASVTDPDSEGYDDSTVYQKFGIRAYLGTYVGVDGDADRTLFFVSNQHREEPFPVADRTFLRLMGQWVTSELERNAVLNRHRGLLDEHELVLDRMSDVFTALDADWRITHLNEGAREAIVHTLDEDLSKEDLLGRHLWSINPEVDEDALEESPLYRSCHEAMERQEMISHERYYEDEDLWVHTQVYPSETGVSIFSRDVTERKERERRLETLVSNLPGIVYRAGNDPDWPFEYVDGEVEQLTGYTATELVSGEVCWGEEVLHLDDRERGWETVQGAVQTGDSFELTYRIVTEDGTTKWMWERGRGIYSVDGKLEAIEGFITDVTGRKARERYQRELYEITARKNLTFEEKLQKLLDLGRERFDLEIGALGCMSDDVYEVVEAVDSEGEVTSELTLPRSETYCRKAVESDTPLGVADASNEGWESDPVYTVYGVASYIGKRVTAGQKTYGTLCFASRTPREEPFTDEEYTFLELMSQWVSYELERERRERQLAALTELSRDLMNAESHEEIAKHVVEHAEDSLELPLTAMAPYDEAAGELAVAAETVRADEELPTARLCERGSGCLWEAFVTDEARIENGPTDELTELVAVPLDQLGVFVTATTVEGGFADAERDLVMTTAATIETAYTRTEREHQLQEREQMLEEQNTRLERLDRTNTTIRNIDRALVRASTRGEIETVVCEQLADVGPYELAWIGEYDRVTEKVVPTEWSGNDTSYLDEITITVDDSPTGMGPTGRAVKTREPRVVDDILVDRSFEPWRQEALNRGYHASAALPLIYEGALYGVLNVYAGQPSAFDELERAVLSELADNVAYALNVVESKKALVSDQVTELEFTIDAGDSDLIAYLKEAGATLSMEKLVTGPEGRLRGFQTTRGLSPETVSGLGSNFPIADVQILSVREEGDEPVCLFEAELYGERLFPLVLEHGGHPKKMTIEDGTATTVVELAIDADVRAFVDMLRGQYPGLELIAQRTRERSRRTPAELYASLTEELTPRQKEVLETAYFSGYFEKPRLRTGSEVAERLDVSQPTFNAHVRTAQRKLCRLLFETETNG